MGYRRIFLLGIDLGYVEQVDGSNLSEDGTLEIVADARNRTTSLMGISALGIGDVPDTWPAWAGGRQQERCRLMST